MGSRLAGTVKRAMARELGKKLASSSLYFQTYGTQRGRGAGLNMLGSLAKRALTSDVAKEAASAGVGALLTKMLGTGKKNTRSRKRKRIRRTNQKAIAIPSSTNTQEGGILPALALAGPLIAKTVGLGALGAASNFGIGKLLGLAR